MSSTNEQVPDPEVPAKARRYSASYKARILAEYEELDKAGKGALLRREGLYSSLISAWRDQRDKGALAALAQPAGGNGDRNRADVGRSVYMWWYHDGTPQGVVVGTQENDALSPVR